MSIQNTEVILMSIQNMFLEKHGKLQPNSKTLTFYVYNQLKLPKML